MSEDGWKRLHPLSALVNLVPRAWQLLRQIWPLMVGWWVVGRPSGQAVFDLLGLLFFLSPALVQTIAHWWLLRYRLVDGRLEVETGLLNRQTRVIAAERVQNVELVRTVFHRLAGLVEVRIETASGTEVEGLLSALSVDEAELLTTALSRRSAPDAGADPTIVTGPPPVLREPVIETSPLDVVWYGATGTRLASVAVLLGFVYEVVLGPGTTPDQLGAARSVGVELAPVLLVAVVTGAWWLGVVGALGRFWGYRLDREGDGLVSEQGLFTRRAVRLRRSKVQVVLYVEPALRRWLGFGSVSIETASARQEGDGVERAETVVPVVTRDRVLEVFRATLPEAPDPDALELQGPHPSATSHAVVRVLVGSVAIGLVAPLVLGPLGAVAWLALPLGLASAWLDLRSQGFAVASGCIVSRRGFWVRRTAVLPLSKVQSASVTTGPLLRWLGLAELTVRAAGSLVTLPVLAGTEASRLRDTILASAR